MADLAKVKRNVAKMVGQNAPEEDIDAYIGSEGVTLDQVRAFKATGASPEAMAEADRRDKTRGEYGMPERVTDAVTFGAAIPITAAGDAAVKTVGKFLSGGSPDPVGDYKLSRDAMDEQLRRARERGGTLGTVAEFGLSIPFMPATAVAGPTKGLIQQGVDAAVTGAKYAGAYGAMSARGDLTDQIGQTAGHAVAGAVLGPTLHYGTNALSRVPGAIDTGVRAITGRSAGNVAENAGRAAEFTEAGVREFGPVIGGRVSNFAARGLARGMTGGSLRESAQGTIDDIASNAQNALARHTQGQPVNDLGADVQNVLRRNLTEYSTQTRNLPDEELARISGPIDSRGFSSPPPVVDPIAPRPVPPVRPEPINPDAVPYEMVQPRPVQRGEVRPQYPNREDIAPPAKLVQEVEGLQREVAGATTDAMTAWRRFDELVAQSGKPASEVEQWIRTPMGRNRFGSEIASAYEAASAADNAARALSKRLEVRQRAVEMERDKSWRESVKAAHAKAEAEVEASYIRDRTTASREAYEGTQTARQKAIRDAELRAQEKATAETARLKAEAEAEARDATRNAQERARTEYEANRNSNSGFEVGKTKETYPTEFSAGYEQLTRATPDYRMNPMGGPTPEGRAMKTATKGLVSEFADSGRRALKVRGDSFDENGAITPEFAGYLRGLLGSDIGKRIAELSKLPPGHTATTPRALRELRTAVRRAKQDAEYPGMGAMPRTDEAAALKRLEGALSEDMNTFAQASGGPGAGFQTETMPGRYPDLKGKPGATQIGDMPPSDMTVYVKPEHLERLTGSPMPNDVKGALPATRSYAIEGKAIMVRRNDANEIDKATRVPFSTKPEVGLRPVQMWKDSNGIHYGSPITSRDMTPGELAAQGSRMIDAAYGEFINTVRKPLVQIYGPKVDPIKAMDTLGKAAETGNLHVLRPFVRVLTEKGDPTRGAASIITHMTKGATTIDDFMKGYGKIPKESRDLLMSSGEGLALRKQLDLLEGLATKMQPYAAAIEKANQNGIKLTHIPLGVALFHMMGPTLAALAGGAGLSKWMSSPRYVKWLTEAAKIRNPGQMNTHIDKLGFIIEASARATGRGLWKDSEEAQSIKVGVTNAAKAALETVPAYINRAQAGAAR